VSVIPAVNPSVTSLISTHWSLTLAAPPVMLSALVSWLSLQLKVLWTHECSVPLESHFVLCVITPNVPSMHCAAFPRFYPEERSSLFLKHHWIVSRLHGVTCKKAPNVTCSRRWDFRTFVFMVCSTPVHVISVLWRFGACGLWRRVEGSYRRFRAC